jgi:hypothetical protein
MYQGRMAVYLVLSAVLVSHLATVQPLARRRGTYGRLTSRGRRDRDTKKDLRRVFRSLIFPAPSYAPSGTPGLSMLGGGSPSPTGQPHVSPARRDSS